MGNPDALSRYSGDKKSEMEARSFDKGQLTELEDNHMKEEHAKDMELEVIDMVK